MSTLTGQQIKDTYDGLLKLADSTTGITSTLQAVQDGLGNDTGANIALNTFTAPNVYSNYLGKLTPQFMGTGVSIAGTTTPGASSQNNLIFGYFYDPGVYSYSALTVNVTTQTSTSDVVEMLFYDLQFVPEYGAFPNNLIMSGITLPVTPTGFQTITLPSTLTFSGYGGGYFAVVLKYTNAGVTPSVRYAIPLFQTSNQSFTQSLGLVRNAGGTGFNIANRAQSFQGSNFYWFSNQSTPATITATDVATRFNTTVTSGALIGFQLHTIR